MANLMKHLVFSSYPEIYFPNESENQKEYMTNTGKDGPLGPSYFQWMEEKIKAHFSCMLENIEFFETIQGEEPYIIKIQSKSLMKKEINFKVLKSLKDVISYIFKNQWATMYIDSKENLVADSESGESDIHIEVNKLTSSGITRAQKYPTLSEIPFKTLEFIFEKKSCSEPVRYFHTFYNWEVKD